MSEYADKIRSVGNLKGGLTKARTREVREHSETGVRAKRVTTEEGSQTYHNTGDTERVDATVTPATIKVKWGGQGGVH